tara:strand:- start:160 stop:600 length:441 start_codon:yes stop_codon:yes gene_type:complete
MAIRDPERNNQSKIDVDKEINVGLQLPFVVDNGTFASTKTTLEAVKNNLTNLCSTEPGERPMQPNLGIPLKQYLFQPFNSDLVSNIQETITESVSYWLPFLTIKNIQIGMSTNSTHDFRQALDVKIDFVLEKDPTTQDSITITVGA